MRKLIAIILTAICITATAAEDKNWGRIVTVDGGMKIDGKFGSYQQQDNVGFLVVRFTSASNNISFYITGINKNSCDAGIGEVGFFDTSLRFIRKEAYVQKGGTGISAIGDLICLLMQKKGTDL